MSYLRFLPYSGGVGVCRRSSAQLHCQLPDGMGDNAELNPSVFVVAENVGAGCRQKRSKLRQQVPALAGPSSGNAGGKQK